MSVKVSNTKSPEWYKNFERRWFSPQRNSFSMKKSASGDSQGRQTSFTELWLMINDVSVSAGIHEASSIYLTTLKPLPVINSQFLLLLRLQSFDFAVNKLVKKHRSVGCKYLTQTWLIGLTGTFSKLSVLCSCLELRKKLLGSLEPANLIADMEWAVTVSLITMAEWFLMIPEHSPVVQFYVC